MKKLAAALCMAVLVAGCSDHSSVGEPEQPMDAVQKRNTYATLEQTADDPAAREEAYEKAMQSEILTGGYLGEVTPALKEDFGVQSIEAYAVTEAIQAIYGDFYQHGIMYLTNQSLEDAESGVWVGIKTPDEKAEELVRRLQQQVDEGRILAKYIHLFESEYSEEDNRKLMDKAAKAIRPMKEALPDPDRAALSISVDTITQTIEIGHDFLTEEQISQLKEQFADYEMEFTQEGRMVPALGESDVEHPEPGITGKPVHDGEWVMSVSEDGMLVVSAQPQDFSQTGGEEAFYSAVHYQFPDADKKLHVGQRVIVEPSGMILESYPGQGRAKFVTVLPAYQPKGADLTEEEAVRQAVMQQETKSILAIERTAYLKEKDEWLITFAGDSGRKVKDVVIADQKEQP
ncbi:DUF3221 domain-containing protein [Bacillus thermotolerans]|uniref:DUF3221 domain-containing protein n=1 Tax=Bacillus thermotolerans TaxID=1221996 RepID=UPI000591EBCA|nr:DUF3221 domain-containing protein [Bacillus thermotolerans]KKB44793.1 hypothetical protein QY96_01074 [Bacillus thermotolerans]